MQVINIPFGRSYDMKANEFSGRVVVEIDGQRHEVEAKQGLDRPDAELLIRQEIATRR